MASYNLHMPNQSFSSSGIRSWRPQRQVSRCSLSLQEKQKKKSSSLAMPSSPPTKYTRPHDDPEPRSLATERRSLPSMWREIQGSNNWEGLLDPLNPILKSEIIRYGEFVMACYQAFEHNPRSHRYCSCKYEENNLLNEVGLENSGYVITKCIYASHGVNIPLRELRCSSRWIGYIAVSSTKEINDKLGRRDILISFRGTVTPTEWVANFMSALTPAGFDPHESRLDVEVELGFHSLYTSTDTSCTFGHASCRDQLLAELSKVINKYRGEELSITVAGHSMGSSLAMLLAYDIAELGLNKTMGSEEEIPITVYSFAGPRVGNPGFKKRCEELGVKVLRVVNVNDPVTKVPGVLFNAENFRVWKGGLKLPWRTSCYAHVGVELALNFFKMRNHAFVHDLEAYLSLLRCACAQKKVGKKGGVGFFSTVRECFRKNHKFHIPWQQFNIDHPKILVSMIQIPRTRET